MYVWVSFCVNGCADSGEPRLLHNSTPIHSIIFQSPKERMEKANPEESRTETTRSNEGAEEPKRERKRERGEEGDESGGREGKQEGKGRKRREREGEGEKRGGMKRCERGCFVVVVIAARGGWKLNRHSTSASTSEQQHHHHDGHCVDVADIVKVRGVAPRIVSPTFSLSRFGVLRLESWIGAGGCEDRRRIGGGGVCARVCATWDDIV